MTLGVSNLIYINYVTFLPWLRNHWMQSVTGNWLKQAPRTELTFTNNDRKVDLHEPISLICYKIWRI